MKRLVLPAVFHPLFIDPSVEVLVKVYGPYGLGGASAVCLNASSVVTAFWKLLLRSTGIPGLVWYCVLLAIFDITAILIWPVIAHTSAATPPRFSSKLIPWVAIILISFFVRLVCAVGTIFRPTAYVPKYVLAYTLGFISQGAKDPHAYLPLCALRFPALQLMAFLICSVTYLGLTLSISIAVQPRLPIPTRP